MRLPALSPRALRLAAWCSDYAILLHHPLPGAAALGAIGGASWVIPIGLTGIVREALHPSHATVWLRASEDER